MFPARDAHAIGARSASPAAYYGSRVWRFDARSAGSLAVVPIEIAGILISYDSAMALARLLREGGHDEFADGLEAALEARHRTIPVTADDRDAILDVLGDPSPGLATLHGVLRREDEQRVRDRADAGDGATCRNCGTRIVVLSPGVLKAAGASTSGVDGELEFLQQVRVLEADAGARLAVRDAAGRFTCPACDTTVATPAG